MTEADETYLLLSPEVQKLLADNDISTRELVKRTGQQITIRSGVNPASDAAGVKDPATILLCSAAAIAAATPLIREFLRSLTGYEPVVRERRLVPVEDSKGNVVWSSGGEPILHWVDEVKAILPNETLPRITGKIPRALEISIGGK